jgi:DNA invertase Pin-like site-specific DNA recombinase
MMVCNTAPGAGRDADLEAAMTLIAEGKVDLVITADLTQFSRHPVEVMEFLQFCAEHSTRVISFEDHLDTGDDDWNNYRLTESRRELLSTGGHD